MKMEKQEVVFDTVVTSYDMKFENSTYKSAMAAQAKLKESSMPIRAAILFEMFPFCILFTVNILNMNLISNVTHVIYIAH